MKAYLALLRGVNVSGKNIIKMEDLRKAMAEAGFDNVKTYIQSGNIVFGSADRKEEAALKLSQLIQNRYGFKVEVFILEKHDLDLAIENNPYTGPDPEPAGTKKIYVTFLSQKPEAENYKKLEETPKGEDEISLHTNVLYFKLAQSAADSKLSNSLIELKLKVKATTRNWNTTLKLSEMMKAS